MSLFAVGITMTTETAVIVAVEKIQRRTGRQRDAWFDGIKEHEDIYETVARIVGVEELIGTVPEMIRRIAGRLRAEPMVDDVSSRVDVTTVGRDVRRVFSDHTVHPLAVLVGGETLHTGKDGVTTIPVRVLHEVATLMFQQERVEFADALPNGPALLQSLRHLEALPESGPARDLGIAAGLAVWLAHTYSSSRAWVSNRPEPPNEALEAQRRGRHQAYRMAQRARGRSDW